MTPKAQTLWCVNIHGPDDIIATPDYITAVRMANIFNKQIEEWKAKVPQVEMDARIWAVPIEYPHSEGHAENLTNKTDDYQSLRKLAREATHDVLAERQRQIDIEGWSTEHDDLEHDAGELAAAAASYALHAADAINPYSQGDGWDLVPDFWPFSKNWWKPNNDEPRRDLVKAGALILAEIERLDREAAEQEVRHD